MPPPLGAVSWNNFFQGWENFTSCETEKKTFSTKNVIEKYPISKSRRSKASRYDTHVDCLSDSKRNYVNPPLIFGKSTCSYDANRIFFCSFI